MARAAECPAGRTPGRSCHLLAHDADDLVQRPLAEEEVVVDACAELANIAGTHQKPVAGHFGVGRGFAKSRDEEL